MCVTIFYLVYSRHTWGRITLTRLNGHDGDRDQAVTERDGWVEMHQTFWGMSLPSNFSDGTKTWRHTRLGQRTSGYETRVLSTEESRTSEYWKFRQFGDSAIRRTIICPKWESTGNRNTIHSACAQVLGNIASAVVESNPAYLQCIPH